LAGFTVAIILYLTSLYNYLLFHSLAEIFSIVVAVGVFMLAWNSRRFLDNNYLLFISIAFLFVAGVDLIHTLAYKGMGVFQVVDANLATQLWIAARYIQALSLLIAPIFFIRKLKINLVFVSIGIITSVLLGAIFTGLFPDCFIEGIGLTPFKKNSEYIISLLLICAGLLLIQKRRQLDRWVLQLIIASILATIGAELALTFYISVYGFSNFIGHFLKILSFFFFYKAMIETGLVRPYDLLFRNLKQSEEGLRQEKEFAESLIETAQVIILVLDPEGKILQFNSYMEMISGYSLEEVKGKDWFETFLPERDRWNMRELFLKAVHTRGKINPMVTKDGKERYILWYDKAIKNAQGSVIGLLAVGQDVTERKRLEEKLRTMSIMDDLTGLYNRRGFLTLFQQQVKVAYRIKKNLLFLFADLDRMKWINDTLGHQEGDRALVATSNILKETFRESDIIGRMGGDEFAVLATGSRDENPEVLIARLRDKIENFNKAGTPNYKISLSVGIVRLDPEKHYSLDEVMARADRLMYEEKRKKQH